MPCVQGACKCHVTYELSKCFVLFCREKRDLSQSTCASEYLQCTEPLWRNKRSFPQLLT